MLRCVALGTHLVRSQLWVLTVVIRTKPIVLVCRRGWWSRCRVVGGSGGRTVRVLLLLVLVLVNGLPLLVGYTHVTEVPLQTATVAFAVELRARWFQVALTAAAPAFLIRGSLSKFVVAARTVRGTECCELFLQTLLLVRHLRCCGAVVRLQQQSCSGTASSFVPMPRRARAASRRRCACGSLTTLGVRVAYQRRCGGAFLCH